MRAGKLDTLIQIERYVYGGTDHHGSPIEDWEPFADMRAQIIQTSTEEFIRNYGATSESVVVFRTRYLDNVTLADRIKMDGQIHNIKELKVIGRRQGLEIRTISRPGDKG